MFSDAEFSASLKNGKRLLNVIQGTDSQMYFLGRLEYCSIILEIQHWCESQTSVND